MTSFDLFQKLFALAVSEHAEQPLGCLRSERLHVGVYALRRGDSIPTHRHDADQCYLENSVIAFAMASAGRPSAA